MKIFFFAFVLLNSGGVFAASGCEDLSGRYTYRSFNEHCKVHLNSHAHPRALSLTDGALWFKPDENSVLVLKQRGCRYLTVSGVESGHPFKFIIDSKRKNWKHKDDGFLYKKNVSESFGWIGPIPIWTWNKFVSELRETPSTRDLEIEFKDLLVNSVDGERHPTGAHFSCTLPEVE